jgi:hypothetical protein
MRALNAALVLTAAAALASWGQAEPATCGAPGKPPCPLQAWMRNHAAAPLATKDADALAKGFEQIALFNPKPKDWQNWNKIAKEGAEAARGKEWRSARSACGRCHRAYRGAYVLHYRQRALQR